ncbi:MAG: sigma-70 family RNA polymerase sigma factor [Spirochaetota bacterium]|nr:sigma-70 family RNA polymerase sigma factor [Spirochaetota bacterium]
MKEDSDIQYMEKFRDGDENAFRILFTRYKNRIISFCFWFCNDRDVAEELAQEVFLRVFKAVPSYRPEAKFSTWIFQIATNVCLNELRKTRYRYYMESLDSCHNSDEMGWAREIADRERQDPEYLLEDKERDHIVQKAISGLPEKQRIALLLRIYFGFSYQDIGLQMKCSESSVKSLIYRGRQNLKMILQKSSQIFNISGR